MQSRSPTNFLRWQEWSVRIERHSTVPGKFRRLIDNATEPALRPKSHGSFADANLCLGLGQKLMQINTHLIRPKISSYGSCYTTCSRYVSQCSARRAVHVNLGRRQSSNPIVALKRRSMRVSEQDCLAG